MLNNIKIKKFWIYFLRMDSEPSYIQIQNRMRSKNTAM